VNDCSLMLFAARFDSTTADSGATVLFGGLSARRADRRPSLITAPGGFFQFAGSGPKPWGKQTMNE
jgi:hypothetical protein